MLCENCHQREATSCVHTVVDGVPTPKDLCADCHAASSTDVRDFLQQAENARCEYCGDGPCAGGTDFLALGTGVQKLKFMCMSCTLEHDRYVTEQLPQLLKDAAGKSHQQELDLLRQLNERADEHLKQWLARGRPG
jgi:hypothetical protein